MRRPIQWYRNTASALEIALSLKCIGYDPGFLMVDGEATVDVPDWLAERIVRAANKPSGES